MKQASTPCGAACGWRTSTWPPCLRRRWFWRRITAASSTSEVRNVCVRVCACVCGRGGGRITAASSTSEVRSVCVGGGGCVLLQQAVRPRYAMCVCVGGGGAYYCRKQYVRGTQGYNYQQSVRVCVRVCACACVCVGGGELAHYWSKQYVIGSGFIYRMHFLSLMSKLSFLQVNSRIEILFFPKRITSTFIGTFSKTLYRYLHMTFRGNSGYKDFLLK